MFDILYSQGKNFFKVSDKKKKKKSENNTLLFLLLKFNKYLPIGKFAIFAQSYCLYFEHFSHSWTWFCLNVPTG